jgi:tRNA threonylcarbamoyladenosine biosynthesis protein TsaE
MTDSDEETLLAGEEFSKTLKEGDVVALNGDLGAGKTVFVKGIAKGLHIEDIVTSPTFTILREYKGALPLYHFDVYRISDPDEMFEIGFSEYLDGGGVSVIEWAEKVKEWLPCRRIDVLIKKIGNNKREIIIHDDNEG